MEYSRLDTPHLPKFMRKLVQRYYFYSYLQKFRQIFTYKITILQCNYINLTINPHFKALFNVITVISGHAPKRNGKEPPMPDETFSI